ncbi:hypothetical protein QTN25_000695 [Entamoeba marina]
MEGSIFSNYQIKVVGFNYFDDIRTEKYTIVLWCNDKLLNSVERRFSEIEEMLFGLRNECEGLQQYLVYPTLPPKSLLFKPRPEDRQNDLQTFFDCLILFPELYRTRTFQDFMQMS